MVGDVAAAAAGSTDDGFGYVGVWAKDAATCATIADPAASGFAVITGISYRDGPRASFVKLGKENGGKLTIAAGSRTINVEQSAPDALTIDGVAMVRCTK